MKSKIFFICILFYSSTALASNKILADSIYYLLDTTKVSKNEKMWDVGFEGKLKYFSILCPCLEYGGYPTFIYRTDKEISRVITKTDLKTLHLISLSNLIKETKNFANKKSSKQMVVFIIEPFTNNFKSTVTYLQPPIKPYKIEDNIYYKEEKRRN